MTYDFDAVLDRRHTNSIKCAYAGMFGKSEALLPMWVADMDFAAPPCILEALHKTVEQGALGYPGVPQSYKEAVTGWWRTRFGCTLSADWLVPIPGVVHALATAVRAYTQPGDGALIIRPVYTPFTDVVESNGRRVVVSELINTGGVYTIDFDDLDNKAKDAKLLILCSPHNPIGRVWTASELSRIAEICLRRGLIIVSDEIHADFVYPGHRHIPTLAVSPEAAEITVMATAPSKTFNIPGLCASNVFIKNGELRGKYNKTLAQSHSGSVNLLGLTACEAAYTGGAEWLSQLLVYLRGNADYIEQFAAANLPGVVLTPLEATYLMWADLRALGLSEDELNRRLEDVAGVWFSEGVDYGSAPGFYRINIGCTRATVMRAMDGLARAFG